MQCWKCGLSGHRKRNCRDREEIGKQSCSMTPNRRQSRRNREGLRCWKCRVRGHKKAACQWVRHSRSLPCRVLTARSACVGRLSDDADKGEPCSAGRTAELPTMPSAAEEDVFGLLEQVLALAQRLPERVDRQFEPSLKKQVLLQLVSLGECVSVARETLGKIEPDDTSQPVHAEAKLPSHDTTDRVEEQLQQCGASAPSSQSRDHGGDRGGRQTALTLIAKMCMAAKSEGDVPSHLQVTNVSKGQNDDAHCAVLTNEIRLCGGILRCAPVLSSVEERRIEQGWAYGPDYFSESRWEDPH